MANYVGGIFNAGIYEIMIELKKYCYLDQKLIRSMDIVKTGKIMTHPVQCLHPVEIAERIQQLLSLSTHNGFPVVDKELGYFLGIVRRDQLVSLLEHGALLRQPTNVNE